MNQVSLKAIKIHIIFWAAFIAYELLTVLPRNSWQFANFWDYACHYTLYILLFYFNAHVALTWTMGGDRKRYLLCFFLIIAQLSVYTGLKYIILYLFIYFKIPLAPPFKNNTDYVITGIIRGIYFLGFSTAYWFALSTLQNRKRLTDLENSHLNDQIERNQLESAIIRTENAYLKSQINPHFLFNSLSFIYNSVAKFNAAIADSVMSLSEIMRYALSDTGGDGKVFVASEVEHIQNFIKLNQARFRQKLCVEFIIEGEVLDQRIIPLILITLVENVFKYGDLNQTDSPAMIILILGKNELSFLTENLKRKRQKTISHGIGIQNLKRRLALYHRFDLEIVEDAKIYRSILKINF